MEILRIEDLTFAYPSCEKNAVDGVSLSVNEGEFIVLCGASGCGKTTLLKLLKRELSPAGKKNGKIAREKRKEKKSRQKIDKAARNMLLLSMKKAQKNKGKAAVSNA